MPGKGSGAAIGDSDKGSAAGIGDSDKGSGAGIGDSDKGSGAAIGDSDVRTRTTPHARGAGIGGRDLLGAEGAVA